MDHPFGVIYISWGATTLSILTLCRLKKNTRLEIMVRLIAKV